MELYEKLYQNFLFNFVTDLVPFVSHLDLKPGVIKRGQVTMEMPVAKQVQNHVSSAHAGALFTLLETLAGGVVVATFNIMKLSVLVKDASIEYFYPGLGTLKGEASMDDEAIESVMQEIKKHGKSKFNVRAEVKNEEGLLVASATFKYSMKHMVKD